MKRTHVTKKKQQLRFYCAKIQAKDTQKYLENLNYVQSYTKIKLTLDLLQCKMFRCAVVDFRYLIFKM